MAFASPEELEMRWRTLSPNEKELAEILLEDAEVYLRAMYPRVHDEDVLCIASCDMVRHAMTAAADAFGLDAIGTAPSSVRGWTDMASAGDMWLSKAARAMLGGGSKAGFARQL